MYFPITCVDNFFEEPDEVRKLALSLDFDVKEGNYPGVRTKQLHEISPDYFNYFCKKLFGLFYDFNKTQFGWVVETSFQKIEPFKDNDANVGWIHRDKNVMFAGIIYLTPNADLNSGTSIFKPKEIGLSAINTDKKHKMFTENIVNKEITTSLEENNKRFIETARFQNIYNRFVSYGAEQFHGVNSFCTGTEPRLTQVFFVKSVTADWFPIPSSKMA
jgi:hypothetical protein